jgi:phosphomannomutase
LSTPADTRYYQLMSVFKTYDIRGVWGQEIDQTLAYRLGKALARYVKAGTWLVGHDARLHSAELYRAVCAGLLKEGAKPTGIGLASTPQLHFTQIERKFEAGIMVTASHNPPQYHGFKAFDASGGSLSYEKGLKEVEAIVAGMAAEGAPPRPDSRKSFPEIECLEEYVDFVASRAPGLKFDGRIVVDVSNGSAGRVFGALARRLGVDATLLNAEPDGRFPNHDPNPLKEESRRQAAEAVVAGRARFGVVLDGDGDRILFIDEKGRGIENYFLSCLIAEELLARTPGSAIVYDLISSRVLPERIAELGGRPVVSRVGYTFLYDKMVAEGAAFGAETSGHVYFKVTDSYYTESAAYALVVLLQLLAERGRPLSELVEPLRRRYVQSPEINVEVADKAKAIAAVEGRFAAGRIDRLDGVSISFDDYWFNVRASNTEPLLRLRLEARTREVALARTAEIQALLAR